MNDSLGLRLHYVLRAVILLVFALYIGHLVQQDALHYYVAPKLARWIRLCPVPLVLMALSLTLQALFGLGSTFCNCDHRLPSRGFRGAALYGLFLFPLLLGFLLPDRALGSMVAAQKGLALTYTVSDSKNNVNFEPSSPYNEEFSLLAKRLFEQPVITVHPELFSETFGAIDMYKESFEGKEIAVSGFLYRDPADSLERTFAVSRFLVQCCTADATPFGIMVDPKTTINLPADTWIEVRGKLHVLQYKGAEIMQIAADSVTPVSQPSTPYIYTSPDSIAAWNQLQNGTRNAGGLAPPLVGLSPTR
ncbi:TIGR03943 family putative permease subunit [Paenibacillus donghaensis]|uniref:TIGR03943 family protein n=1 Tax=Paenibacillus donghaensis TaxID=414771 RepID=A0A2Z2KN49_9BACL|nr:TIGR03943 family protein [Paenibacillus donghaensis]ASA20158.1 TIGR03943 family protein [Paenibacillus donghaensis]